MLPCLLTSRVHRQLRFINLTVCLGLSLGTQVSWCMPPQESTAGYNTDASQTPPIYLKVRLTPNVKRATAKYLDQIAEGEKTRVKKGETLAALSRRIYGFSNKTFRTIVNYLRPELSVDGPLNVENVSLPPGPLWSGPTEISPPEPIKLKDLALLEIGFAGEKTKESIEAANPSLKGRWEDFISPSEKVHFPYVTRFRSIPMRTRSIDEAKKGADLLKEMDPEAVASAEAEYGFYVVPSWSVASMTRAANTQPSVVGSSAWWFQTVPPRWDDLSKALRGRVTVAVLDTGLVRDDPRFQLWRNKMVGHNQHYDNPCRKDEHGCNFLSPALFPEDDCKVASRYHHGTHIAGLVSARLLSADLSELDRRIDLMIVKIADDQGRVSPYELPRAIKYAGNRDAKVINLSLTGAPNNLVLDEISSLPSVVFVAAAGNADSGPGSNFEDHRLNTDDIGYPARWSNPTDENLKNLISVAAHDADDQLSNFSNYSEKSIDLAAPGSQIESIVDLKATKKLDGTSQATALVSLAAALLASEGVTANEIKRRIISTTDFVPALVHKVSSAGKLNIANALDLRHDIIKTKSGLLRGCIELRDAYTFRLSTETNDLALRNVYRILLNYSEPGKTGTMARVTMVEGENLVYKYGDVRFKKISFVAPDGPRDIDPSDVVDVILTQAMCSLSDLSAAAPH